MSPIELFLLAIVVIAAIALLAIAILFCCAARAMGEPWKPEDHNRHD